MEKNNKVAKHHHRFFVKPDEIQEGFFITKDKNLINQIKNVFRLHGHDFNGDKEGDHILVLDGTGWEYEFELEEVSSKNIDGCLVKKLFYKEDEEKTALYLPLLKKEKFEMVLQKCTEIGVSRFIPVTYNNCIVKDGGKKERWEKIIKEAAEQSGRSVLPKIVEPTSFSKMIKLVKGESNLVATIGASKNILDIKTKGKNINIFIGPEGDFSPVEIDLMEKEGFLFFNLGDGILRSETACIVASGIILQNMLK